LSILVIEAVAIPAASLRLNRRIIGLCVAVHRLCAVLHHLLVKLRPGLTIEDSILDAFAKRWGIRRLALYGSVLREDFGPSSDIDMLVEFLPDRTPGLLQVAEMELELESVLGRQVELRTYEDLSPFFRDSVAATARQVYAA
jgi:predicted nucleotidyltransferase